MAGAESERPDGGQALQCPVQQEGDQVGGVGRGRRLGGGGQRLRPVRHLAALLVQFGDALAEEVQQGRHGDRAGRELEEGEHLGHGLDGLGDRGGLDVPWGGVDERPGVEERHPAAEHGGVVAVPGAQPPAGPCGVAVQFHESGEAGPVPAGAHLGRGQLQRRRGPFEGLGGQGRGAGARTVGRPAGDPYGVGQGGPGLTGQFRAGRSALGRAGRGPGAPGDHGLAGGGEGSRADKSQPGVARGTGRHGSSLASDGPKAQTEPGAPVPEGARTGRDQSAEAAHRLTSGA